MILGNSAGASCGIGTLMNSPLNFPSDKSLKRFMRNKLSPNANSGVKIAAISFIGVKLSIFF
jgi:hypothetical protein